MKTKKKAKKSASSKKSETLKFERINVKLSWDDMLNAKAKAERHMKGNLSALIRDALRRYVPNKK